MSLSRLPGDLSAQTMHVFETEVLVCGDLTLQLLTDHDDFVSVLGIVI